jgi:predicted TIM-barrel fold metal-dependent hydrolase
MACSLYQAVAVHLLFSEDMAVAREWLDREPRLRSSIVVPLQNASMAIEEIERRAPDRCFVQVPGLSMEYPGSPRFVLSRIVTLAANVLRIVAIRRRAAAPILTIFV